MKKIAIFLGDFFWSSHPYDGLELYESLSQENFEVSLIMFSGDIRLNKKEFNQQNFSFDSCKFQKINKLLTVNNWKEFSKCVNEFDVVISSSHISPKTRMQRNIKNDLKKELTWFCWDIGGADVLTNTSWFADGYFLKGDRWKNWISTTRNFSNPNNLAVTGSPHYDGYLRNYNDDSILKKYGLSTNQYVLVSPSNPTSHLEMYQTNLATLEKFVALCESLKYTVCVKTHPSDYLFYEDEKPYSGVYRRSNGLKQPQWKELSEKYGLVAIESQDGIAIMKHAKFLYNISGSHLAWETHFTKKPCFTMNYLKQKFCGSVSYLKGVEYPDKNYNIEVNEPSMIFEYDFGNHSYNHPEDFILAEHSVRNIVAFLRKRYAENNL